MYTAYIGKRLIELINQREGKDYTAKAFFDEVYVPLFFGKDRYLLWINNSPFDQAYKSSTPQKPPKKDGKPKKPKKIIPITDEILEKALKELHFKVKNVPLDGSFFLGGAASESKAPTSGQVTDISLPISEHEVYASWIGAAMGVGVGDLNILVDADEVLWELYNGWIQYRKYMSQTPTLKPHQVNTWNGYWLTNVFDDYYDADYPFASKTPPIKTDTNTGVASLETTSWIKVIFALSKKMPKRMLNSYVYSLSQMNTTVGFIAIELPAISSFRDLYRQILAHQEVLAVEGLEMLYDTPMGFQKACELGKIGIPALEPNELKEYIFSNKGEGKAFKPPKDSKETNNFILYQTWIIAMLDNQKLVELSQKSAIVLLDFANQKDRGKTTNRQLVDSLLESAYLRQFIERLEELIKKSPSEVSIFENLFETIVSISTSNFPMFKALLRIRYAIEQAKQSNQNLNENN